MASQKSPWRYSTKLCQLRFRERNTLNWHECLPIDQFSSKKLEAQGTCQLYPSHEVCFLLRRKQDFLFKAFESRAHRWSHIFLQFSYNSPICTQVCSIWGSSAVSWTQNEYTMCQNACAGITRSKHCNTGWNPTLHDITEHGRWFWSMLSKRNKRTKDSGSTELTGNIAAPWK